MFFDYVVSLGAWCQTTYQIKNHGLPLLPSCFDWIVTPWEGMNKIFATDGSDLVKECFIDPRTKSVMCSSYGVLYHHEFPRDEKFQRYITQEAANAARNKLLHKYHKMANALSEDRPKTVLFVRSGGHAEPVTAWPYSSDSQMLNPESLNEFMSFLKTKYPKVDSRLLWVRQASNGQSEFREGDLHPHIFTASLARPQGEALWYGDAAPWTQAFTNAFRKWGVSHVPQALGLDPSSAEQ